MVALKSEIQNPTARIKPKTRTSVSTSKAKLPLTESKFTNTIIVKYDKIGVADSISYWLKRIISDNAEVEAAKKIRWLSDKSLISSLSGSKRGLKYTSQVAYQYGLMAYYLDDEIGLKTAASCIRSLKGKPNLARAFAEASGDIAVNTGNSAVLQLILANISKRELKDELVIPIIWYSKLTSNLSGKNEILRDALVYLSKLDEESERQALTLLTNISVCGNASRETKDSIAVLVSDTINFLTSSTGVDKSSLANLLRSRFYLYPESISKLTGNEQLVQKLDFLTRYILIRDYDISIELPSFSLEWMNKAGTLIHGPISKLEFEVAEQRKDEEKLLKSMDSNGQFILPMN